MKINTYLCPFFICNIGARLQIEWKRSSFATCFYLHITQFLVQCFTFYRTEIAGKIKYT